MQTRLWRSIIVAVAVAASVAPAIAQTTTSQASGTQQLVYPHTAWARIDNPQSVGWSPEGLTVVREQLSWLRTTGFMAIVGGRLK